MIWFEPPTKGDPTRVNILGMALSMTPCSDNDDTFFFLDKILGNSIFVSTNLLAINCDFPLHLCKISVILDLNGSNWTSLVLQKHSKSKPGYQAKPWAALSLISWPEASALIAAPNTPRQQTQTDRTEGLCVNSRAARQMFNSCAKLHFSWRPPPASMNQQVRAKATGWEGRRCS